jgi:hypothetical protein
MRGESKAQIMKRLKITLFKSKNSETQMSFSCRVELRELMIQLLYGNSMCNSKRINSHECKSDKCNFI